MTQSGSRDLFVSDFLHKAKVQIDSKGTKASAASVVMASRRTISRQHEPIIVDEPFFFGIYYARTNTFLFTGVINNPNETT